MERFKARAYTDLLVPILFLHEKYNKSYVKLRQEHAGPLRENFPGGTKVDTGPQILLGPPSLIGAHAVRSFFVGWV